MKWLRCSIPCRRNLANRAKKQKPKPFQECGCACKSYLWRCSLFFSPPLLTSRRVRRKEKGYAPLFCLLSCARKTEECFYLSSRVRKSVREKFRKCSPRSFSMLLLGPFKKLCNFSIDLVLKQDTRRRSKPDSAHEAQDCVAKVSDRHQSHTRPRVCARKWRISSYRGTNKASHP